MEGKCLIFSVEITKKKKSYNNNKNMVENDPTISVLIVWDKQENVSAAITRHPENYQP